MPRTSCLLTSCPGPARSIQHRIVPAEAIPDPLSFKVPFVSPSNSSENPIISSSLVFSSVALILPIPSRGDTLPRPPGYSVKVSRIPYQLIRCQAYPHGFCPMPTAAILEAPRFHSSSHLTIPVAGVERRIWRYGPARHKCNISRAQIACFDSYCLSYWSPADLCSSPAYTLAQNVVDLRSGNIVASDLSLPPLGDRPRVLGCCGPCLDTDGRGGPLRNESIVGCLQQRYSRLDVGSPIHQPLQSGFDRS